MRPPDEFEQEIREIRLRKFRRMFDPMVALIDDDDFDDRPRRFYLRRIRPVLIERAAQDRGKRPFSVRPSWSLPAPSGRGRPIGADQQRIPHTRNRVGGHQNDAGLPQAVIAERYNTRHERNAAATIEGVAPSISRAAIEDDRYLNRLELDAIADGLPSAVRTNMDRDPLEREREWTARTRHERKAGKPRINIKSERDPALCAAIAADARWPEKLRIAILADLNRRRRGEGRPKWKRAGEPWIADDAGTVMEDIRHAYGLDPDMADAALTLSRPRAGRVMYKWDAELPRELDEAGRQAYLDRMAAALDATGITYLLVMHRPDPLNHPDNYHVHLLYSDRPVAKLSDGSYDIEKVVKRDYGLGRLAQVHQRQPKHRFVSDLEWTATLRRLHVDHCNQQLEQAGALGRYNAGGFADIGLGDEIPQRKLGSSAARLEAAGVATEIGVSNAFIDWDRIDERRRRKHARRMARIAALHAARIARGPAERDALEYWRVAAERAEHARVVTEELQDTIAMALSRPTNSANKAAVIASSCPPGSYDRHRWSARSAEAQSAIIAVERELSHERAILARVQSAVIVHAHERDRQRRALRNSRSWAVVPGPALETVESTGDTPRSTTDVHRFIDQIARRGVAVTRRGDRFGYDERALRPFGLSDADLTAPAVQSRLAALHTRQQREIASVAKLAAKAFVLDARSDTPHVRAMISRWRDHPDILAATKVARSSASPPAEWHLAAARCEALMAEADKFERQTRDSRGIIVPSIGRAPRDQQTDSAYTPPPNLPRRTPPGFARQLGGYER